MNKKLSTPPVAPGALPIIGHLHKWTTHRDQIAREGQKKHGNVFAIKMGPKPMIILSGPKLQRFFYTETDKLLNISKPVKFMKYVLGDVLFIAEREKYLNQRTMVFEPFRRGKMMRYITVMQNVIQSWLDGLGQSGRMEITAEITSLTQKVASASFFGEGFEDKLGKEFWDAYVDLGKAINPMAMILPPKFPTPRNIRRDRARKKMMKILKPILAERRAYPKDYDDYLQDIINKPQADGTMANDEDILSIMNVLMFAGHETTAGQAGWSIIQLLQNPWYRMAMEQELKQKFPYRAEIDMNILSALDHVRWAVDETTRMKPSADMQVRITNEEIELEGYRIPKNSLVAVNGEVTHFLPEYFKDPFKYDPYRYAPPREEHKQDRFIISSFGGGQHKCAGMNFANNEMMMIVAMLFQQFELTLETQDPTVERGMGVNRPSKTWIQYKRRKAEDLVGTEVLKEAISGGCPHLAKMTAEEAAVK